MAQQIRGIILEGQSCSGKTSMFNAIRKQHGLLEDAERNTIFLGEHYSQSLNYVHDKLVTLTRNENLKVLSDRIEMLENLSEYADNMGVHSKQSRGLFYVFERFYINYAFAHNELVGDELLRIEERLISINPIVVLCTISDSMVESRLRHRATYTGEEVTNTHIEEYIKTQKKWIEITEQLRLPVEVINTDQMEWEQYAKRIMNMMK
ncbi:MULTISPECIES: hypothetical protein [unclassified Fusibacter]|uniref:hypothetical protein n=1 Tax=unclassified Fusibacter TaxID=2624464 RepID=UPI0010129C29|nr:MULTISPECIES: hypothetical protein [unclassified Fusibacter]MCK8061146.1 hypothetical protein [Fusibacter sp. A2]NPE23318.1 hypothetical protein [Fusibacter sp. A1]RXV59360.1 hypothetical protein DWB64_15975 [Fusibacter sp. A1]